jgi:hypothetical protein
MGYHDYPIMTGILFLRKSLIVDALMCPYRIGERVRVQKLLRSVTEGMLLMWDRELHSYKMVNATIKKSCHYLGLAE